jgi:hypothetical protein
MPARREASALPPIATVRRPKVVRLSSTQPAITTTANAHTGLGTPSSLPPPMRLKASTVTTCGTPPEMLRASPLAAASIASVAMNATMRP